MTTPPSEQDTERTETRQSIYFVPDGRGGYNPGAFTFEDACRIAKDDSINGQCAAFVNADFVVVPDVIYFAGIEFRAVGERE